MKKHISIISILILSIIINSTTYAATTSSSKITASKTITATTNPCTLTWDSSLSSIGSYLGSSVESRSIYDNAHKGWKTIVYTDVNGNKAYANPYQSGSITPKPGTRIHFKMIAGTGAVYGQHGSAIDLTNDTNMIKRTNDGSFTDGGPSSYSNPDSTWIANDNSADTCINYRVLDTYIAIAGNKNIKISKLNESQGGDIYWRIFWQTVNN